MRLVVLSLLLLIAPSLLHAQGGSTPSYDIRAYCAQVSQAVGGSYQIEAGCVDIERTSRASVERMVGVEPRILSYCDEVATAVGGSYQIYEGCIKQELEAKSSLGERARPGLCADASSPPASSSWRSCGGQHEANGRNHPASPLPVALPWGAEPGGWAVGRAGRGALPPGAAPRRAGCRPPPHRPRARRPRGSAALEEGGVRVQHVLKRAFLRCRNCPVLVVLPALIPERRARGRDDGADHGKV